MFLGKQKICFWENSRLLGSILEKFVFLGWSENCKKIQEVRLCEKRASMVDVRKNC